MSHDEEERCEEQARSRVGRKAEPFHFSSPPASDWWPSWSVYTMPGPRLGSALKSGLLGEKGFACMSKILRSVDFFFYFLVSIP